MTSLRILGIIPARAGSKGVPEKNTRLLFGKSLIERAYEAGRSSGVLSRIILSSNDPSALRIAQFIGLETPFVRPDKLADDRAPMLDVVLHALSAVDPAQDGYDAVMLLQPSSPLRTGEHLRRAVDLLERRDGSAVCSVVRVPLDRCPHYLMKIDDTGRLKSFMPDGHLYSRRQDVPVAYHRCGTIFLTRVSVLKSYRSFYGEACIPMVLPNDETINIDTLEDWREAERRVGPSQLRNVG